MMKKIILGLIILMISTMVFATNSDVTSGQVTITLQKGWNLMPAFSGPASNSMKYLYTYSANLGQYCGGLIVDGSLSYSDDCKVGRETNMFNLATNYQYFFPAVWIYSIDSSPYVAHFGSESVANMNQSVLDKMPLTKGWNFVVLHPWMVGNSLKTIFDNCNVTALNRWDAVNQKWFADSSTTAASMVQTTTPLTEEKIGEAYVVKVLNDCQLNKSSTESPPSSPN